MAACATVLAAQCSPAGTSRDAGGPTPPAVTGFADEASTGVPDGLELTESGPLEVTEPGTVIDGLWVRGTIHVAASGVVIRRTRVSGADLAVVAIDAGLTGVVIEDSEIDGQGAVEGSAGVRGPVHLWRSEVRGVENGVVPEPGSSIIASLIHELRAPGDPHYDGIEINAGGRVVIRGNTVVVPEQTAAVMISNYFGPVSDVVVDRNHLLGGTYTVYVDAQFGDAAISGVEITDNSIGGAQFGAVLVRDAEVREAGNVDSASGAPVGV